MRASKKQQTKRAMDGFFCMDSASEASPISNVFPFDGMSLTSGGSLSSIGSYPQSNAEHIMQAAVDGETVAHFGAGSCKVPENE